MDNTRTNLGEVYTDDTATSLVADATTTFDVLTEGTITMTKTVDRVGEFYLPGDSITFTITITNNGTVLVDGLFFRDVIDAYVVPATGTDYVVTTTSGTVTSSPSPVTISDISVPVGGTVTITISGVIAG